MANYCGMTRTNYFKIKDEAKFRKICEGLCGEDNIDVEVTEKDGQLYGFIGSYSSIDYCVDEEDCDYDWDSFVKQIQEVIADDDAMLMTEIGNEKLRYLVGICTIITSKEVRYVDLETTSFQEAKQMLNNEHWTTKNVY